MVELYTHARSEKKKDTTTNNYAFIMKDIFSATKAYFDDDNQITSEYIEIVGGTQEKNIRSRYNSMCKMRESEKEKSMMLSNNLDTNTIGSGVLASKSHLTPRVITKLQPKKVASPTTGAKSAHTTTTTTKSIPCSINASSASVTASKSTSTSSTIAGAGVGTTTAIPIMRRSVPSIKDQKDNKELREAVIKKLVELYTLTTTNNYNCSMKDIFLATEAYFDYDSQITSAYIQIVGGKDGKNVRRRYNTICKRKESEKETSMIFGKITLVAPSTTTTTANAALLDSADGEEERNEEEKKAKDAFGKLSTTAVVGVRTGAGVDTVAANDFDVNVDVNVDVDVDVDADADANATNNTNNNDTNDIGNSAVLVTNSDSNPGVITAKLQPTKASSSSTTIARAALLDSVDREEERANDEEKAKDVFGKPSTTTAVAQVQLVDPSPTGTRTNNSRSMWYTSLAVVGSGLSPDEDKNASLNTVNRKEHVEKEEKAKSGFGDISATTAVEGTHKRKSGSHTWTEEDDVDNDTNNNNVKRGEIEIEKETKKAASLPTKKKKFVSKKESSIPVCSKGELIPLAKRPNKKRKKEYIIDDEECEVWTTDSRKTAKGGYTHTNSSKRKISQANSGNKPWNLGKQRSTAVKAKISASVRAINRTRLLGKLQLFGMTEEEWMKTKKEIKTLRERIRRTKKANQKGVTELLSRQLQETLDTIDETKMDTNGGRKVEVATCDNDGGDSGKDNGNSNSNGNNTNTNNQTKPITTNESTNSSIDILLSFSPSLSTTTTTKKKKKKQNTRKASRPLLLLRVDDGTKECKSCILGPKYKHGHDVTCQRSRKYVCGGVSGVGKDKSKNNTVNYTNKGSQTKRTTTTTTTTNTNTKSYTDITETLLSSEQNHEQQQCNKKISINQTTMSSSSPKSLLCVAFDATRSLFDLSDVSSQQKKKQKETIENMKKTKNVNNDEIMKVSSHLASLAPSVSDESVSVSIEKQIPSTTLLTASKLLIHENTTTRTTATSLLSSPLDFVTDSLRRTIKKKKINTAAAAATAVATAKGDSNSSSSKSTAVVDTSIEVDKKVATTRDSATNETKATVNTRFFGWL